MEILLLPGRPPVWGLDAARKERGASATEGRGGGGGSPGLQAPSPKAGDTAGAGTALAVQCRGALQGPRISRPWRSFGSGKRNRTEQSSAPARATRIQPTASALRNLMKHRGGVRAGLPASGRAGVA